MLIRPFWAIWLASRRCLNLFGRELAASRAHATPARKRHYARTVLKRRAKRLGLPWRRLLGIWGQSLAGSGLSQDTYRISINPLAKPVPVSAVGLEQLDLVSGLTAEVCLHPDALSAMQEVLRSHPQGNVIYTDHDHLDEAGQRCRPHFKPDWNPDLFYSRDYIGSSVFFRRSWLESLPEDVQQLDAHTLLKVLPYLGEGQIVHIPRVLCHCLDVATAAQVECRESLKARDALITEYLNDERQSIHAEPGLLPDSLHIIFPLPNPLPLVSLIIPTRDRLDLLKPCVDSILQLTDYAHYEILIVDNGSEQDETHAWFAAIQQADPRVHVLPYPLEFNYSAINNHAVRQARGSVIGLVNNDIEVISPGWLSEMVRHARRPDIGCVGAKLYYPNGQIQHAGVILGSGGGSGHAHRYFERDADGYCGRLKVVQNMTAVTGACLLVRKSLFEQVGGLNEVDLKIAWNDIDLCLKVRAAGYRNLWTPHAELYHHESVSRGRDRSKAQRLRYKAETAYMHKTWGSIMWNDPCYNPNLTVAREDFSLGFLSELI